MHMHEKLLEMGPRNYRVLGDVLLTGEGIRFFERRSCLALSFPRKGNPFLLNC